MKATVSAAFCATRRKGRGDMKARILVMALALVLALGTLVGLNVAVSRTELPIDMTVKTSMGDKRAAAGLTVDYRVAVRNCLRWYTRYTPAEGSNETDFYLTYRQEVDYAYTSYEDTRKWNIMADIGGNAPQDPIFHHLLNKAISSERETENSVCSVEERVYPADYYAYYPLCLCDNTYGSGINPYRGGNTYISFDKLRIPTDPQDCVELGYNFRLDGDELVQAYCNMTGDYYAVNQFTPYCVRNKDSVVVTVGFDADVTPKADWAPEGFGLWYLPVREQELGSLGHRDLLPVAEECRLVYPLDIETQRVMLLEQSGDGGNLLLVTVENDRYVLRVLDGDDYHLVREIDLDEAKIAEESRTSYLTDEDLEAYRRVENPERYRLTPAAESASGQNELTIERRYYPAVTLNQGENFAAIMMSDRLAVLTPSREGYDLQFVCDTVSSGSMFRRQTRDGAWELVSENVWITNKDASLDDGTPRSWEDIRATVSKDCSMAYNGTYLASAIYCGTDLLLSVYGPEGIAYAELSENSVLTQDGARGVSELPVWWNIPYYGEDIWNPQPGLRWQ